LREEEGIKDDGYKKEIERMKTRKIRIVRTSKRKINMKRKRKLRRYKGYAMTQEEEEKIRTKFWPESAVRYRQLTNITTHKYFVSIISTWD
jgi:hypothetical protein